jgi:hypothetical protein
MVLMRISGGYGLVRGILFFVLYLMFAAPSSATQPLFDQYTDGVRTGHIFPSSCCWVELRDNERIWEIRRQEIGCSARGGPVGRFKLEAGKLWLTGLMKCGGDVPLQAIYPDMKGPVVAEWLTGTFKTRLDFQCTVQGVQEVYAVTQELTVDKGVVQSLKETRNDTSACAK